MILVLLFVVGWGILICLVLSQTIREEMHGWAIAAVVLLSVASLGYFFDLSKRRDFAREGDTADLVRQFDNLADAYLKKRFGTRWRLLAASATLILGTGTLVLGLEAHDVSSVIQNARELKPRVLEVLRETQAAIPITIGPLTGEIERLRLQIREDRARDKYGADALTASQAEGCQERFNLIRRQAELEFLRDAALDRQYWMVHQLLEKHKEGSWLQDQRAQLTKFVDLLTSRHVICSPTDQNGLFPAESLIWMVESNLPDGEKEEPVVSDLVEAFSRATEAFVSDERYCTSEIYPASKIPDDVRAVRAYLTATLYRHGAVIASWLLPKCVSGAQAAEDPADCERLYDLVEVAERLDDQTGCKQILDRTLTRVLSPRGPFRQRLESALAERAVATRASQIRSSVEGFVERQLKRADALYRGLNRARELFLARDLSTLAYLAYSSRKYDQARENLLLAAKTVRESKFGASASLTYPFALNGLAHLYSTSSGPVAPRHSARRFLSLRYAAAAVRDTPRQAGASYYDRIDTYTHALFAAGARFHAVLRAYEALLELRDDPSADGASTQPKWKEASADRVCKTLGHTTERPSAPVSQRSAELGIVQLAIQYYKDEFIETAKFRDPSIAFKKGRLLQIRGGVARKCGSKEEREMSKPLARAAFEEARPYFELAEQAPRTKALGQIGLRYGRGMVTLLGSTLDRAKVPPDLQDAVAGKTVVVGKVDPFVRSWTELPLEYLVSPLLFRRYFPVANLLDVIDNNTALELLEPAESNRNACPPVEQAAVIAEYAIDAAVNSDFEDAWEPKALAKALLCSPEHAALGRSFVDASICARDTDQEWLKDLVATHGRLLNWDAAGSPPTKSQTTGVSHDLRRRRRTLECDGL